MAKYFLYLAKDKNLQIQETEWIINRMNPKKSNETHPSQTSENKEILSVTRDAALVTGRTWNDTGFLIRNYGGRKHVVKQFLNKESKEQSAQNPKCCKSILQEWRGNLDILRWRKTKGVCGQKIHPKRMAKEHFLNEGNNKGGHSWNIGKKKCAVLVKISISIFFLNFIS